MNRSGAALLIAILVHLVLLLVVIRVEELSPKVEPKKPKEQRIKVSLKENPKAKKDALVKNDKPEIEQAPPLPKGEQLKELTPTPQEHIKKPLEKLDPKKVTPKPKPKVIPPRPKKPKPIKKKKPVSKPLPPKKVHIKTKPKLVIKEHNVTKHEPKVKPATKDSSLFDILSQDTNPQKEEKKERVQSNSRVNQDIKKLYGDTFGKLSAGEQKYILDNQEIMRRITQEVLNRVGRVNIPRNFVASTSNTIEFYLHTNGDITGIKFIKKSGYFLLDETTKETIQYAYSKYPRPEQKTLIRYQVGYYFK
ncbi:MAG: hypothetical protein GQ570_03135 [Helicobacteraceae bacterium]|nr:hypothetical protein [Helicobacteraceae bacterium]